jgi:nucleoside-diphosphate-sugar epimerase
VGRNFLAWLAAHQPETEITCLVRDAAKAQAQWAGQPHQALKNVRWLAGDLLEPDTYAAQLAEAEQVFHIAALVSLKNGPEFYAMNTDTTRNLVQTLGNAKHLQRLVFVSSISAVDRLPTQPAVGPLTEDAVPHPNTDYGKSKRMAEELVISSGLPYSILRPSYIYGAYPRLKSSMDRLIHDVRDRRHYTRFPFPGRASEVYVEDLAEMIWLAGHHPQTGNETFFVSNPQPVRIADVFRDLAEALEVPYQPMDVSPEDRARFQSSLYRQHPENLLLRILFEDYFLCSADKWYHATGYQPRFGYREGLARTVCWYREQGLL